MIQFKVFWIDNQNKAKISKNFFLLGLSNGEGTNLFCKNFLILELTRETGKPFDVKKKFKKLIHSAYLYNLNIH